MKGKSLIKDKIKDNNRKEKKTTDRISDPLVAVMHLAVL
jgi:hypothetical protein